MSGDSECIHTFLLKLAESQALAAEMQLLESEPCEMTSSKKTRKKKKAAASHKDPILASLKKSQQEAQVKAPYRAQIGP